MRLHDAPRLPDPHPRALIPVIGVPIDATTWSEAISRISAWASGRESRYVCLCNVHSTVTARNEQAFAEVIANADMATPDGAPIAWLMRRLGAADQERINGPDLMWRYCASAEKTGEAIFLYGGEQDVLDSLQQKLLKKFPNLQIAGAISPPFRDLTPEEEANIVEVINAAGAGTLWVSLGCPKQEQWMARHRGRIAAVMIGVGAAFDYHAGTKKRAPLWMQRNGLEWLYRLKTEPSRLWKRYLVTNSLFVYYAVRQLGRVFTAGMR